MSDLAVEPSIPSVVPNFVGGQTVESLGPETEPVLNPATGQELARAPIGSAQDIERAGKAASEAFSEWSRMPPGERSLALLRLADAIEERAEELAKLESLDVGKPMWLARAELPFLVDNLRFFAGAARTLEGRSAGEYMEGRTSMLRREPLGVVGAITAWNFPLCLAIWKIGPALAAGNTVILKPSELTPLTSLRLAEIASEHLPAGVFNVVPGHGATVGQALVASDFTRMVSFTGSIETGVRLTRDSAPTLKKLHLELGGKAPVIVFDDADPQLVIETLRVAGYYNSGQDCTAACRVLAQGGLADEVAEGLGKALDSLAVDDPASSDEVEMGPVVSEAHRERVLGFIERAADDGGRLVRGGTAMERPGFFVDPTVVSGVEQSAEIAQQEVFGPVVTVQSFDDEAQALEWANGVKYGLAASVFTGSVGRANRMARDLQFGTVWINDHLSIVAEMPFGGYKSSGHGNEMSVYAVEQYTQTKHVMSNVDV